ncbi:tetratricopeptide repeat protein [Wenzhouxiangella sp. AB-CW3]|uniref:heme biosynthesis protein HemY n=1 Tax=Wenzhouxiangella sp. AB-CW3 TaxID=2771012 RepID=UPI00168C0926|nr:heme biosynthesis HemY N-terminal domain-containing protein [Wenzhouxiangella sp. AB-CW3]QOC23654.1 tetratricopeptide repeat protein [Wenzhouxiangella sp. AB-CW3]
MKRLLLIVLVVVGLVAAALLAPILLEDPGHVVIDIGQWRVEMSLLVLVGGMLLAWMAFSLLSLLLRLPTRAVRRAREVRSRRHLENGFLALTEGDWNRAERSLQKALKHQRSTAGYLAAARAAQGQGDRRGRDRMLALADTRFGRRHFVTDLARARLLIGEGRVEEAVPVLESLHLRKPRHTGVLRLLLECYQDLGRWRDMRLLSPALRRAGVVDRERGAELAAVAGGRELESAPDVEQLDQCWKELGRKLREHRGIVLAYARRCAELDHAGQAGRALSNYLRHSLDDELLRAYADVGEAGRAERIARLEDWQKLDPDHAGLLLALGLLYLDDRQYDKAKACLEQSVRRQPGSEAYAALGRVLDHAGNLEAAAQCYRNALRLKTGRGAEPLPPP